MERAEKLKLYVSQQKENAKKHTQVSAEQRLPILVSCRVAHAAAFLGRGLNNSIKGFACFACDCVCVSDCVCV